jgi:outer membrane murein-binding lipoprotein Lpp
MSTRRGLGGTLFGGAVLLGTTMLAGPAGAESLSELKERLIELKAKVAGLEARQDREAARAVAEPVIAPAQAVQAGTFRSSIKLPGTNTSFQIGSFVKLDAFYTTVPIRGGDSFFAHAVPFPGTAQAQSNGAFRMHARQSRIFLQTRTPTKLGQVRTYIEGDFFGGGGSETVTNGSGFRLRHAYGQIENLLIGQTWSNIVPVGAYANHLDFGVPMGQFFARQAQIRYTFPLDDNWSLIASVENPHSEFVASVPNRFFPGVFSAGLGRPQSVVFGSDEDRIPDFVAKVTYGDTWGILSLAGLLRVLDINTLASNAPGAATILDEMEPVFAISGGGRIYIFGDDSLGFTFGYSDGAGRTFAPFFTPSAYVNIDATGTPSIETIESFGGSVNYEHSWSDNVWSVASYGISHIDYPSQTIPPGTIRPAFTGAFTGFGPLGNHETLQDVRVNLRWDVVPHVNVGIEWMATKVDFNLSNAALAAGADDDTTVQRVQFSVIVDMRFFAGLTAGQ